MSEKWSLDLYVYAHEKNVAEGYEVFDAEYKLQYRETSSVATLEYGGVSVSEGGEAEQLGALHHRASGARKLPTRHESLSLSFPTHTYASVRSKWPRMPRKGP